MQQTSTSSLATLSCMTLKGVGPDIAERLEKLGIRTIQDLLFHLPFRYQDRTRITPIIDLRVGDYAVIDGVVIRTHLRPGRKVSLMCQIQDNTGLITLRFFHFNHAQRQQLTSGTRIRCFGEVRGTKSMLEMIHPEYRCLSNDAIVPVDETLTPIYPTTNGLQQRSLQRLIKQALLILEKQEIEEVLPASLSHQFNLFSLRDALHFLHHPPPDAPVTLLEEGKHPAQQRLIFEELLAQHLCLRQLRQRTQHFQAPLVQTNNESTERFLSNLSFQLTAAQQRVISEISHDLEQSKPMLRLVQGDVGSGKTVVSALAALQLISAGYQVALMAPTEILAEQHYQNFLKWFEPLGLHVSCLAGKMRSQARRRILEDIILGISHIVIGTHALFQKDVMFKELGLIIIDEQHRFGVHQRLALKEKGESADYYPHQLIMTATPIPRTLAMTAYADLDLSVIDELPPGRTPIQTVVIANSRREEVIERIREICHAKQQVYWVCTLIEESEVLQCQAAEVTCQQLKELLPELRIGLVHGRLPSYTKDAVMQSFKQHEIDLLIATTVIEVGVDIPNASLMVIENSERLGLSQLHQLRGRVGRGHQQSYCVLLYQSPLSEHAKRRLHVMRDTTDGFKIAEEDLQLRGAGELLGTRQTGIAHLKIANIVRDHYLFPRVQQASHLMLQNFEEMIEPLIRRWMPEGERFASV